MPTRYSRSRKYTDHTTGRGDPEHEDGLRARSPGARAAATAAPCSRRSSSSDDEHAHLDEERHARSGRRWTPTSISRGNHTFLIRLALASSDAHPAVSALARKFHGSRPHSRKKAKHVEAARVADGRVDLEEEAEDEREDHHLRERVEQRPAPAEDRSLVLAPQLAQREVGEQLAMAAESRRQWSSSGGTGAGAPGRTDYVTARCGSPSSRPTTPRTS